MSSEKSFFMLDDSETSGPAEHVMDYFISYTLRLVNRTNKKSTPCLYEYVVYIINTLFSIECESPEMMHIRTYKQSNHIDLIAELELTIENSIKYYALLIEDKYTSSIRFNKTNGCQLKKYVSRFNKHYKTEQRNYNWILRYVLIAATDNDTLEDRYSSAKDYGFHCYTLEDLLPINKRILDDDNYHYQDTEDELFNQFWLRDWY